MHKPIIIGERDSSDGAFFVVLALIGGLITGGLITAMALASPSAEEIAAICRGGL